MRRSQVVRIAVFSGLLSVLLAVAVNVATGGELPGPLAAVSWLAWPAVGLLAAAGIWLAYLQQRVSDVDTGAAPAGAVPAELPPAPAGFAGRAADLATVARLLDGGTQVISIVGPPGAGKSSLALRVAHEHRDRFPDGQLFALMTGADADAVLVRFLTVLGVPEDERRGDVDALAARFRSAVAHRRLLVLLDDARDADQVRPLLPGGPGCRALVTSRRLLAELPGSVLHPLGGLDEADALAILAEAAGTARIAADPAGSAHIVQLCAGLPLAVRIAGSRLRARPSWTPADLATRLADERRRLDELRLGDAAVRSTFATSYRELSTVDQLVFRRAGSHPGPVFGVPAAAALAGMAEPAVATTVERLVDAHLVESPAPGRYRLHDLLRLFAAERLAADEPPADRDACLIRLLDWLTAHAQPGDWLAQERDNVLAAVHQAVEAGAYQPAWALVSAVHPLLLAGDHTARLPLWRAAATAATALGDDARRARALRWVSNSYRVAGEVSQALAPAAEAVAIAERLGDRSAQAEGLRAYGEALHNLYRYADAERALTAALDLFAELGDNDQVIEASSALGTLYNTFWQPQFARPVLERAAALLPAEADHRHAWVFTGLSIAYKFLDRRDDAAAFNTRALEVCRRLGDDIALGYALIERGWLASEAGRPDDAIRDMRAALSLFERIPASAGVGTAHESIGSVAAGAGRHTEALAEFDAAIAQFERLHDRVRCGRGRLHRASILADLGRVAEARSEWAAAEALIGDVDLPDLDRIRQHLRTRLA